jgi:hypothetical protein
MAAPRFSAHTTRWSLAIFALVLGFALLAFSPMIADPDLWGHVRFGEDLWQSGNIIRPDVYSYLTGDQPWINHEWLTEAIYAVLYGALGAPGLIALNVVLGLLVVGAIYWHLLRRDVEPASAGCIDAFFALLLRPGVLNVRPQVFTYLMFLAILLIIDMAERGVPGWLWAVPAFIALWTNLHGGVLAGLGVFLLWGTAHLATAAWRRRRLGVVLERPQLTVAVCMVASCLALLLNPYGIDLVTFLLRTVTVPRPEITEWKPATLASTWGQLYFAGLGLLLLGLVFTRRERKPALVLVVVCTAILPLLSIRHIPLFAVAAPTLAGEHLANAAARLLSWGPFARLATSGARFLARSESSGRDRWVRLVAVIATLVMAGVAFSRLDRIQVDPAVADFPARAVAMLKASGARGNMATEFNWGEYVLWHLGPAIQVSMDGRRETIYSDTIYRENLDFMLGRAEWERLIERPETQLALVHRQRPVFELMKQQPGWQLVYQDSLCAVFVRAESPLVAQIRRASVPDLPPDGSGLSFPQ